MARPGDRVLSRERLVLTHETRIDAKVVVMTAGGLNPSLVINALSRRFRHVHVLMEEPERKGEILARRARRFGAIAAFGQLATMAAAKFIRRFSQARVDELVRLSGLPQEIDNRAAIHNIPSINSTEALALVKRIDPAAVLLVSTRLMARSALAAISCPVLNLHAGINPAYRGQMGGYWSLVERDSENFGATIHLVDAGTDTGATLYRSHAEPTRGDNIATYPLVITVSALDITVRAVEDAVRGQLRPITPEGPSSLRFPPTLWAWIWFGITRRIW